MKRRIGKKRKPLDQIDAADRKRRDGTCKRLPTVAIDDEIEEIASSETGISRHQSARNIMNAYSRKLAQSTHGWNLVDLAGVTEMNYTNWILFWIM